MAIAACAATPSRMRSARSLKTPGSECPKNNPPITPWGKCYGVASPPGKARTCRSGQPRAVVSTLTCSRGDRKFESLLLQRRVTCEPGFFWQADVSLARRRDHEGEILEVLVQRRRDRRAAVKLGRNRSGRVGQVYTILADALEPAPAERERRS